MATQNPFALQNRTDHTAALFRQAVFSAWRQGGIVGPADLQVSAQATPNMSVKVSAGRAWMVGTQIASVSGGDWSPQAAYFGINDAPLSVSIATADPTNPRIDLICAYVQDQFYSGSNNQLVIAAVTGTPAASPAAPSAPSNAIVLAQVAVAANATSIVSGNITNTAGLMTVARGGILPVTSTDSTAGKFDGQYRDHPTLGLQRWSASGSKWVTLTGQGLARASMTQSAAQTGNGAGAWVSIALQTNVIDTAGGHSTTVNNTRWTCPTGQDGTYLITGGVTFDATAGGARLLARIAKNGTQIQGTAGGGSYGGTAGDTASAHPVVVTLAAGDYVELQGFSSAVWSTAVFADDTSALNLARLT